MVAVTYTSNLVDVFLFESTTGVTAYGGGAAGLTAETEFAMEGTNAVDKQVTSSADKGFLFGAASAFVIGPHDHFYEWIYSSVFGINDTRDNHGIHMVMGDDNSNFVKFHVDGIDTLPLGGGKVYAIRFNNTALTDFRTLVGSPTAAPDSIGGGLNVTGNSKDVNLGVDGARQGSGYLVLNGTGADDPGDFAGIASDDESTAEGVFQNTAGGFNLQGKIRIGNGATEAELTDSNTNVFIIETIHALENFTELLVAHQSSILTLTNVSFIAISGSAGAGGESKPNRGRFEMLTPIIDAQDETSYDNSPTTEGTFAGGTGYAVSDVITMSDNSLVTVDTLSGSAVLTFTVDSSEAYTSVSGTANTQVSVLPTGGTGFTLTPDTDNLRTSPTASLTGCGFIGFGESVLDSGGTFSGCRWVGANIISANNASMDGSTISNFEDQVIVDAQDETSYDNSPTTEGTFSGGTSGYAASDIITMIDGSLITVDAVSTGVVTQFTVDSSGATASLIGVANTEVSNDGGGSGDFSLTPELDNLTEVAALKWETADDPNGKLDNMDITKGTNPTHAIEFGTSSPLSITLTDMAFSGYNASNSLKDSTLWFRRTGGTITLNLSGVSGNLSYKSDGATVNVVSSVDVNVNVTDKATGSAIQDAQVYIQRATPTAHTAGAGNTAGDGTLVVTAAIDADQPQEGFLSVLDRSESSGPNYGVQGYRHASWTGSTFTFPTTVTFACTGGGTGTSLQDTVNDFTALDIKEGDTIRNTTDGSWAVVDEIVDADSITTTQLEGGADDTWTSGDSYSVHDLATTLVSGTDTVDVVLSNEQTDASGDIATLSYDSTQAPTDVIIRVRTSSGATKYIPEVITGQTISATAGLTVNVTMTEDTVAT